MDHSPIFSVIIPALNEEDGIADIIRRVLAIEPALKSIGISELELIVVDDGSIDRTVEIVNQFSQVRLLKHPHNLGYGAAIKTGFRAARGDYLSFLDADGTYPPESYPDLLKASLAGADVVVGSRRSGEKSEMPLIRRIGNFIWSNLVSAITFIHVKDPASGMRIIRSNILESLYPLPDGLNFTPVMSVRTASENLTLVEVPIPYKERIGRSKLSVVRDGLRFLSTILWTALTYNPARIVGAIAFFLIIISAVIFSFILGLRFSGYTELDQIGVFALFSAVTFAIVAVDLFSLSNLFGYLVGLFHKYPIRQGLAARPIIKLNILSSYGWLGFGLSLLGAIFALVAFIMAEQGWAIERLWLYLLAGTMVVLIGIQLILFWVIARVLQELRLRQNHVDKDMGNNHSKNEKSRE